MKVIIFYSYIFCFGLQAMADTFIFSHGLGGNKDQIYWYSKNQQTSWSIMGKNNYSFDFPEVVYTNKKGSYTVDQNKVNLAQEGDIAALAKAISMHGKNKVLIGVSRGAACIITYCATKQPEHIKAAVLEAPFDTLENIIQYQVQQYKGDKKQALKLFAQQWSFPSYNPTGIKPIGVINNIDKKIPLLFVHSKADKLISINSSRVLYCKLKENGHEHVFLLELETGDHAQYQVSPDAYIYQATVHAFYKKYGITYDTILATAGEKYLNSCKPTCAQVKSRISSSY